MQAGTGSFEQIGAGCTIGREAAELAVFVIPEPGSERQRFHRIHDRFGPDATE